jgi:hypothetical protein
MAGERHAGDVDEGPGDRAADELTPPQITAFLFSSNSLSSFDCWLALDGTARSGGEASTKRWIREVEILAAAPEVESLRGYGGRAYSYFLGLLRSNKLHALVGKRTL